MRGFAILAVILIHTSAYYKYFDFVNGLAIGNILADTLAQVANPLFIVISGLVLSLNYRGQFSLKTFYNKRFMSIIPQYVFFSLFYLLLIFLVTGQAASILDIVVDLLTGNAYSHLWFFVLIIQFYLLYPLLLKVYDYAEKKSSILALLGLCLVAQILWAILGLVTLSALPGDSFLYTFINSLFARLFVLYIFYFMLGMYAGKNFGSLKARVSSLSLRATGIALGLICLLTAFQTGVTASGILIYGNYDFIAPMFLLLNKIPGPVLYLLEFLILFKVAISIAADTPVPGVKKLSGIFRSLGKYSFGIYLIHPFFMFLLIRTLRSIGITYVNAEFYLLMFGLTALVSYASVLAISYLPFSGLVIGVHNTLKNDGRDGKSLQAH